MVASSPAQSDAEAAELRQLRARIASAQRQGFAKLLELRPELFRRGQQPDEVAEQVLRLAFDAFLPWCTTEGASDAERESAAESVAAVADLLGRRVMVRCGDPRSVMPMLEAAWALREAAGYRGCDLAMTFADALRLEGRYAAAEAAMEFCAGLLRGPAAQRWDREQLLMAPVHELKLDCRRASLELELGNPDAALTLLQRAARRLTAPRATPPDDLRDGLLVAWYLAEAQLRREQVDCLLGTERFGAAVRAAAAAVESAERMQDEEGGDLASFYLTLARSWDPATPPADMARVLGELERIVAVGPLAQRRLAATRLVEAYAQTGDHEAAERHLADLAAGTGGALDARLATVQTQLLLMRDRVEAVPKDRLEAQRVVQERAFRELLEAWRRTPVRDDGVGFLHYLFRRETIGQLVAITLRAASAGPDSAPPESAVVAALQHVLAAQEHGVLARRLAAPVPEVAELRARLGAAHGIVLFLPTTSGTHVFTIDDAAVRWHLVEVGAVEMRHDVQQFVELLEDATTRLDPEPEVAERLATQLRRSGAALTTMLLPGEVRQRIGAWRSLTVIGSELLHGAISGAEQAGFLNYLPVECLPWTDDELFGQHFAIDHNTSLPLWARLADDVRPFVADASPLRLFGVLQEGEELAADDRLAGSIAARMGDCFEQRSSWLDENCTVAAVAGAHRTAAGPAVAVFVVHGGYDASRRRGSFLQLYDGRLDCDGVQRLGTPDRPFAALVVLLACRAAKAPDRAGDGLANLGGAFQMAGASTVVLSRFDLPLHRTLALLDRLLAGAARGESVAEALRAARSAGDARDPLDALRTGVLQVHGCGQRLQR